MIDEDRVNGRDDVPEPSEDECRTCEDGTDGRPWWKPYAEDPAWHRWYAKEFDRRFARSFADPENARAEAVARLLTHKLPNAKLNSRDNLDALVRTSFRNLCRDLIYAEHGKVRAPLVMRRLGPPDETVFFLFCLHGKKDDEIAEELHMDALSVRGWTTWLKAERKCPERIQKISLTGAAGPEDPDRELELPDREAGDDPTGDAAARDQTLELVELLLGPPAPNAGSSGAEPLNRLERMREMLRLDDDERLLLRSEANGVPPMDVASLLGIEVHTVRRRRQALFERVRDILGDGGFEAGDFGIDA